MNLLSFLDIPLETANKFYSWGWKASLVGAAITLIGVSLLMWGTRARDHDFETNMTQLNTDAAKANERAAQLENDAAKAREKTASLEVEAAKTKEAVAQANERAAQAEARAAEANLELAKLKAPRSLSSTQQNRIMEKLKKFSGTTFEVITYPGEPEPVAFSSTIAEILVSAGWRFNPNNSRGSLLGLASGVVVVIGKQAGAQAEETGKALLEALASEGVSAKLGYDSLQINPVAIAIKIQVGKKP